MEVHDDNAPKIEVIARFGLPSVNHVIWTTNAAITEDQGTIIGFDVVITMGKSKLKEIEFRSKFEGEAGDRLIAKPEIRTGLIGKMREWKLSEEPTESGGGIFYTSVGNKKERLTFRGIDTKDRITTLEIEISVKVPKVIEPDDPEALVYYLVSTQFGCQNNASNPNFYSIFNQQAMNVTTARNNQGIVDFAFYNSVGVKVGSPANTEAANISFGTTKMSSFTTKNVVNFFNAGALPTGDLLEDWWDENLGKVASETNAPIVLNNVVFFKKANPARSGAFIVKEVGTGNAAAVRVEFIVKQD